MAICGICYCDVPGCKTPPMTAPTTLHLEFDAVCVAGWQVVAGVVRCPACVAADRWPEAAVGTRPGAEPTMTPWLTGPEQGMAEPL